MKKMRIPLLIVLGIAILGIILGSFLDLQISQAIASPTNGLALTISAVCPTIGFGGLALIAGAWAGLGLKKDYPVWARVLFWIAGAACLGASIKYAGGEYFGVNGFAGSAPEIVGYLIAGVVLCGAAVGGYFLFKDTTNDKAWIVLLIAMAVMGLALLPGVSGLKAIFHRPRFRAISAHPEIPFFNWYQPNGDYQAQMTAAGLDSEEFKSFPSGHTCETSILLVTVVFMPLINPKLAKRQTLFFCLAAGAIVLVGFGRILAAAHFLSDVSMGAFLMVLLAFIANEVVIRLPILHPAEEE
ncbi:MAG: phosphatase PAP2 family protein [Bacilli bacterium]|nr:phosphatase PAP2 family protein [Bacilli bacterium]